MTNGEKFKEIFSVTQVDDCDLNVYVWLPNHDVIAIPPEWWNAPYMAENMLQETLENYGNKGYRLVNVVMANNIYNTPVMYCFFTKESEDKE